MEERKLIIEGDFNIRIGELGKFINIEESGKKWVGTGKDKVIGNEGGDLINLIQQKGWVVWKTVIKLKVDSRIESDYAPLCLGLLDLNLINKRNNRRNSIKKVIYSWSKKKGINLRKKELVSLIEEKENDSVEERWTNVKEIVRKAICKNEIKIKP